MKTETSLRESNLFFCPDIIDWGGSEVAATIFSRLASVPEEQVKLRQDSNTLGKFLDKWNKEAGTDG